VTLPELIGRTLGRYRIDEALGAGGMGAVYRARDQHLERDVALKVLPAGAIADEPSRRRFRREALTLARLSHPNIGAVLDFDVEDGVDFLVMEFVPGSTLADKLKDSPLPETEVIAVGIQIAEALQAAHEQGVVHRDLKPGNVMIGPRQQIKVLDFGLAKLERTAAEDALSQALTGPAMLLGTLPYMAPEQLQGKEVDSRCDLFALGGLLYEAATGQPPFSARLSTALVSEILTRSPTPPRELAPALSRDLERVILQCLEKKPEDRFAGGGEVAAELRRIQAGVPSRSFEVPAGAAPRIRSLAVLPLENLSRDPEQEYFADGMTEALIGDLAKIGALRVISRTSAMRYKGVSKPLPEIARELNADAIVEGSVLKVGDRVRITAQLIDAASDRHLWAERYERDVRDVLALQSEVAQAIAREIQVRVTHQEQARLASPRPIDPEAHEAYLKGRFYWNQRSDSGLERGIGFFHRAIERDPTYAPAYSGLADCFNILADRNKYPPAEAFPKAKAAALKALELDENSAEAHTSLAYVLQSHEWDWVAAEREYRRSIELDAGYATGHQWYGILLACLRRLDEAIFHTLEAVKLDPLSIILYTTAGDSYYYARRFDDAIAMYRKAIDFDPSFHQARFDLGRSLEQAGRYDEAIAEYQTGFGLSGDDPAYSPAMACTHAFAGRREVARPILAALIERARERYVPPYSIASIHAALGEVEEGLRWLTQAYEVRDRAMVYVQVNPRFDRLRSDPRFGELVRRMRFPS
jgi:TolB-like protein/Flp pilus assembly protein TadD